MAKKKSSKKSAKKSAIGRIVLRTGEALVEADEAWSAAEPEVIIGELDGPVGFALANLMGNQVKGHTKVFAILNSDVQVLKIHAGSLDDLQGLYRHLVGLAKEGFVLRTHAILSGPLPTRISLQQILSAHGYRVPLTLVQRLPQHSR